MFPIISHRDEKQESCDVEFSLTWARKAQWCLERSEEKAHVETCFKVLEGCGHVWLALIGHLFAKLKCSNSEKKNLQSKLTLIFGSPFYQKTSLVSRFTEILFSAVVLMIKHVHNLLRISAVNKFMTKPVPKKPFREGWSSAENRG